MPPLAPPTWDFFALDNVPYRGRSVAVVWDRTGARYGKGAGLRVFADGKEVASRPDLGPLTADLPPAAPAPAARPPLNYAVNNDGLLYPRASASFTGPRSSPANLIDGNVQTAWRTPGNSAWSLAMTRTNCGSLKRTRGTGRSVST